MCHYRRKKRAGEVGVHGENLFWAVPPPQWVRLLLLFPVTISFRPSIHLLFFSHSPSWSPKSLPFSLCLCAGQSLTSVKAKAGEALRLHKTSVGEEAREEEEERGAEEKREGGGESGETDLSSSGESSASAAAAPGRGVFSTITHAVQNTVSEHTYKSRNTHTHTAKLSTSPSYKIMWRKPAIGDKLTDLKNATKTPKKCTIILIHN